MSIQQYLRDEFDLDISELKAKLLLEYFIKEVGPFAYNQGVKDSEKYFRRQVEDLSGTCHQDPLTYWKKLTATVAIAGASEKTIITLSASGEGVDTISLKILYVITRYGDSPESAALRCR